MCRRHPPPPTCLSGRWTTRLRMGEVYGCRGELEDFACQRDKPAVRVGFAQKPREYKTLYNLSSKKKEKKCRGLREKKTAVSHCSWGWSCRPYQLGVVGGDLEGRLLVSRCSDEIDLCRTGFHTIPPTTRWHTGPLQIRKEKKESSVFMKRTYTRIYKRRLTSRFYCCRGPGVALSAFCRTEPCCCCVWGSWWSGWRKRRSDDPHRTSTGSYRSWGRAEPETPHNPGSPPATHTV